MMRSPYEERVLDMRLLKSTSSSVFWVMASATATFVVSGLLFQWKPWPGSWVTLFVVAVVSHFVSRHARLWLKMHNVKSEFSDPFDFPDADEVESNGATKEMNWRAHA